MRASLLGDPAFPKVALGSYGRSRIPGFQDIYKHYSSLTLTDLRARPIAIAGLEKRLVRSLGGHGGYGVIDDDEDPGPLRRSLLWCRGTDETSLQKISFQPRGQQHLADEEPPVPSWSWMAHQGKIDYLYLYSGIMEWEVSDIVSPWIGAPKGTWLSIADSRGGATLNITVRAFKPRAQGWADSYFTYDCPMKASGFGMDLKCVILGTLTNRLLARIRTHYFILVIPSRFSSAHRPERLYERVGVGYLPVGLIDCEQPGEFAILC